MSVALLHVLLQEKIFNLKKILCTPFLKMKAEIVQRAEELSLIILKHAKTMKIGREVFILILKDKTFTTVKSVRLSWKTKDFLFIKFIRKIQAHNKIMHHTKGTHYYSLTHTMKDILNLKSWRICFLRFTNLNTKCWISDQLTNFLHSCRQVLINFMIKSKRWSNPKDSRTKLNYN